MTINFEKQIEELAATIAAGYGVKPGEAKIFTTLYLEPEPVALEEIARKTGYSLSTISTKMKFMEGAGMVQRVKKPGTKKVYYFMKKDLVQLNLDKIHKAYAVHLTPVLTKLPSILKENRSKVMKGKDEKLKQKFRIMEDYLTMVTKFDKLLQDMLKQLQRM
jgi:DNA-binding transcriptional regulator GbsR (MarR family)